MAFYGSKLQLFSKVLVSINELISTNLTQVLATQARSSTIKVGEFQQFPCMNKEICSHQYIPLQFYPLEHYTAGDQKPTLEEHFFQY